MTKSLHIHIIVAANYNGVKLFATCNICTFKCVEKRDASRNSYKEGEPGRNSTVPCRISSPSRDHNAGTRCGGRNILGLHFIILQTFAKNYKATSKTCDRTQSGDCSSLHWEKKDKKENEAEKNVEKGNQEGREWWKWEGKASLMFPAKIFRLLPHDASPCPTHITRAHSHTLAHGAVPSPSIPSPPRRSARVPAAIFDDAKVPVHTLFRLVLS